jgi:hypothetical protein
MSRSLRRGHPIVALISGMAPAMDPIANAVTVWPAADSVTPRPPLIAGRSPAGIVSSMIVMNPAAAGASRPPTEGAPPGLSARMSVVLEP